MNYKKDIHKNIFRGYDIRGIYPTELDEDTAYTVGLGFGSYIKSINKTHCVVGHDNRISSPILYNALIKGILESGLMLLDLDFVQHQCIIMRVLNYIHIVELW